MNFGNIFHAKNKLLARIAGIQKAMDSNPSNFFVKLEYKLTSEFNQILDRETEYWKTKSRINWLEDGDRNTQFFHSSTITRRRKNRNTALKDNNFWVFDDQSIENIISSHFSKLFTTSFLSSTLPLPHPPSNFRTSPSTSPILLTLFPRLKRSRAVSGTLNLGKPLAQTVADL